MKKVLCFVLLSLTLCLTACGNKLDKVKLVSFSQENVSQVNKRQSGVMSNDVGYQFVVLQDDDYEFDLTIVLDNENDYHIFDFNLTCDDEEIEIIIDNEYVLLKDLKSINWKGGTNSKYTISLISHNKDYLTTLKLTAIYYSDRETKQNVYDVDLNGKETVEVYRVDFGFTSEFECIENKAFKYALTLNSDVIDKDSIYFGDTKIELNPSDKGYVYLPEDKKTYDIKFRYALKENLYYDAIYQITVNGIDNLFITWQSCEYSVSAFLDTKDTNIKAIEFYNKDKKIDVEVTYDNDFHIPYFKFPDYTVALYEDFSVKIIYEDYSIAFNFVTEIIEIGD